MMKPAALLLADGTRFDGEGIGSDALALGEAVFYTGMTGYEEALMLNDQGYVAECTGDNIFVVKRGEHGVLYFSRSTCFLSPAYLLETVRDPTGAGDTFAGGMIGYLSTVNKINGPAICKGIVYGSIMASFTVEDFSVDRLAKISKRDISRRYDHFRKITRF